MRILKYALELVTGWQDVKMPHGARIIHVHEQHGLPTMWVEADPSVQGVIRTFMIIPTGHAAIPADSKYVGTVHIDWTVWHVYER